MADPLSSTDGAGRVAEALERLDEDALAAATDAFREWLTHSDEHDYGATARWVVANYLAAEVVPRERTRVLEEALEFYADPQNHHYDKVAADLGELARSSLAAVAVEDEPIEVEASGPSSNETADSVDETRSARPVPAGVDADVDTLREDFEVLVTDILVSLGESLHLPEGPDVDDAREAVMRELLAHEAAGTWRRSRP